MLPFAGTAHPERFFAALRAAGCEVAEPCALPDHAPLPPALLARLRAAAERAGAVLATTEKDAARLPAAERDGVAVLPLELRWADDADDALEALLGRSCGGRRSRRRREHSVSSRACVGV